MPLVLITLIIGAVSGMFATRRVALALTGAAAALTLLQLIWAVVEGVGNDPWWIIPVGLVGCGIALAVAAGLSRGRQQPVGA